MPLALSGSQTYRHFGVRCGWQVVSREHAPWHTTCAINNTAITCCLRESRWVCAGRTASRRPSWGYTETNALVLKKGCNFYNVIFFLNLQFKKIAPTLFVTSSWFMSTSETARSSFHLSRIKIYMIIPCSTFLIFWRKLKAPYIVAPIFHMRRHSKYVIVFIESLLMAQTVHITVFFQTLLLQILHQHRRPSVRCSRYLCMKYDHWKIKLTQWESKDA